jgi:hypothetical protein
MFTVLKWFFGAIAIVILLYILVVLIKTFFGYYVAPGTVADSNSEVKQAIDAGANTLAYKITHFNLNNWVKDFHPFAYAPVYVVSDNQPSFFDNNDNYTSDFDRRWGSDTWVDQNQDQNKIGGLKATVQLHLASNSVVDNFQAIRGMASENFYINDRFSVDIVDGTGAVIGSVNAYKNGVRNKQGFIPFRVVLLFSTPGSPNGYLVLRSGNTSSIVKIYFSNYYSKKLIPGMLFPSPRYQSGVSQ